MNIQTVRDNLKNTIAGKEQYLAAMRTQTSSTGQTIVSMLEINLEELKHILQDVEQCDQFNNYEKWDGDE